MTQLSYKTQKRILMVTFLFIPIVLLLMFSYYPAAKLLELSFTQWDGFSADYSYIGLENYISAFKDKEVLRTLLNNMAYIVVSLVQTFLGLYLAIILNGGIKGRHFFRSVIFTPYILNGVAIAFMFNYMYDFERGPINVFIRSIGLEQHAIRWLSESYMSNFSLGLVGMWRYTGFAMVIFLGALQSIDISLYEAAKLDGADFLQKVRYITIPSIRTVIELNMFLAINGAMQAFFEAFIITKGGPAGVTDTFVTSTLKIAFEFRNFGKASAMGIMLMLLVVAILGIQRTVIKDRGN